MEARQTMAMFIRYAAVAVMLLGACGTAAAQTTVSPEDQAREAERIRGRQRIATMEAILATAITNGAQMVIAQVRTVMPSDRPKLLSAPRVSGVKLDDYGMVFHVQVPVLQLPIMWDLRQQLVQQDTQQSRQTALLLQQLRTMASTMPPGQDRARIEEMVFNLERQIEAGNVRPKEDDARPLRAASLVPGDPARPAAGAGGGRAGGARQIDPRAMEDPQETYTREVKVALIEAMLQNNQAFSLSADEWLTIVAVDSVPNNPLMPGDSIDSSTWVMRVKGSVLSAYRSGTITLDEARKQVQVSEQ